MKKSLIYILLLLFPGHSLSAQILKGIIYDEITKEPVTNVNVYLEGTSYFTITDAKGLFILPVKRVIQTNLIISHITYETVTIRNPFTLIPDTIQLKERQNLINEVTIAGKKGRFSRKYMLKAFKEQFLGSGPAGQSCIIENENDILFYYDRKKQTLHAFSENPIIIKNPYLGYEIRYELKMFRASYSNKTLFDMDIQNMIFMGLSSFKDLLPDDPYINRRRRDAFTGSATHFFRSLYHHNTNEQGFKIYSNFTYVPRDSIFISPDSLPQASKKIITLKKYEGYESSSYIHNGEVKQLYGDITIIHHNNESRMLFFSPDFSCDFYGNKDNVENMVVSGYMSKKRVGDLLPLDYEF